MLVPSSVLPQTLTYLPPGSITRSHLVSYQADPAAFAINAFHMSWQRHLFYAFPPFSLHMWGYRIVFISLLPLGILLTFIYKVLSTLQGVLSHPLLHCLTIPPLAPTLWCVVSSKGCLNWSLPYQNTRPFGMIILSWHTCQAFTHLRI